MKKSIYTYVESYKNNFLLFNVFSLTCVILDKDEYKRYNSLKCSEEEKKEFLRLGFYVEDDFDEVDAVCYASRCLTDKDKQQFYRIYTTLACNAKCPYCYEKGAEISTMSVDTADKVCEFIKDRMVEGEKLGLEWFGGEPLLNKNIINYICEKLQPICKKKKIKLNSSMVSNGYLINEDIVKDAKNLWNLRRVQITIDGLKKTYEKIKQFNDPNSFDKVISNIKLLLDNNIFVSIRLNYDKNNFDEILKLIDFLGEKFNSYKNVTVYARRIMDDNIDNSLTASEKTDLVILKQLEKNGFEHDALDTITRRDNTCIANMLHAFMILPDGNLGKCSQAISKGDIIGNVVDGVDDYKMVRWCSPRLTKKCLKCKRLPLCNGGCIYEKLENKNYCFASERILKHKLKNYLVDTINNKEQTN